MAMHVSRILRKDLVLQTNLRAVSTHTEQSRVKHHPVVVLGGGSGGCSMASRLCRLMGQGNVAVVEPSKRHVYQPLFTLVGAGIKKVTEAEKWMKEVLPTYCVHYQHKVAEFNPEKNQVILDNGDVLEYRFLIVGLGMQNNYHKVDGLQDALHNDPMVCSNYCRTTVEKTFPAFQAFEGGNALFTFPNTPVKCAGAPQKIMYLADEYWRKNGVRDRTDITYKTSIGVIFGVKKYAERLEKIAEKKGINVDFKKELVALDHTKKEATFKKLDSENGDKETCEYNFIHVCPPMSAPDVLKNSKSSLVDQAGFLDLNKHNLQHVKYPNIFGLGDCTNLPTSKTAAAISTQSKILLKTVKEVMMDQKPTGQYDGYTSCPLITGYNKCILAEFDYNLEPLETFPVDQGKERRTAFHMKKDFMPHLYWKGLVNGYWSGPRPYRKLLHFGMSR